jgi:UDP-glucuronate decarboxylase
MLAVNRRRSMTFPVLQQLLEPGTVETVEAGDARAGQPLEPSGPKMLQLVSEAPKRQRVLVTGGAGFVGSHLCEALLARGCEVTALDDFTTGRLQNVAGMMRNERFALVHHDVREPFDGDYDLILHFACPASPPAYQENPVRTAEISFGGTLNALSLARRTGARLVFASTSEVYGDPLQHPQNERYRGNVSCTGPRACYDEGKRIGETLCFDFHRQHQVDIKVVRIFNTYGPRMNPGDGRVVSNFIVQALSGAPITIYGDGSQTRSFCYIDDLVRGILLVAEAPKSFLGPVNLGNPKEFTVLQLAECVRDVVGSSSPICFAPLPEDDPRQRRPDIGLARRVLRWSPRVPLREGVRRMASDLGRQVDRPMARPASMTGAIPAPAESRAGAGTKSHA